MRRRPARLPRAGAARGAACSAAAAPAPPAFSAAEAYRAAAALSLRELRERLRLPGPFYPGVESKQQLVDRLVRQQAEAAAGRARSRSQGEGAAWGGRRARRQPQAAAAAAAQGGAAAEPEVVEGVPVGWAPWDGKCSPRLTQGTVELLRREYNMLQLWRQVPTEENRAAYEKARARAKRAVTEQGQMDERALRLASLRERTHFTQFHCQEEEEEDLPASSWAVGRGDPDGEEGSAQTSPRGIPLWRNS
eukprot:TRINITY_DN26147_c0_g1_i2.p1 TRINITY_DN26147_c0_g1~~TRINITY_DN26147_c0_g1_i2.p1  ORF type:complete len:249 (+),score=70.88 TRINITY_DN26147_c0_g1_i2:60-806(+)